MSAAVLNPSHRILQGYLAVTWYALKLCENKRKKKKETLCFTDHICQDACMTEWKEI